MLRLVYKTFLFYPQASYLELHIRNYHDGGRPYACDHPGCSKTFIHKGSLAKHQVVHKPDYVRPPPKVCGIQKLLVICLWMQPYIRIKYRSILVEVSVFVIVSLTRK